MKKILSRRILLVGSMVFMALIVPIVCGWGRSDKYLHSFWVRWLNNNVDGRINFYGRVVDQFGSSVESAEILVHIRKFRFSLPGTPWRVIEFHLKTDAQGYFKIVEETGMGVSFYDFKKAGYEYFLSNRNTSFNYQQNTNGIFHPDPNNPEIYRMRKKGEEAYLLDNERIGCFEYDRSESGVQKSYDFITGNRIEESDLSHPMRGSVPLTRDITTKADFDPKTNRWKILIRPGDSSGGILVSPEKWYEAPADGYLPSYTIDPDVFIEKYNLGSDSKPWTASNGVAYVYLKSRTPPVYTRFSISRVLANEHMLGVGAGGYVTNPYGDRNLEPATGLSWRIRSKLDQDVRDCYINGRRPLKPNLSKLIQEDKAGEKPR